LRRSFFNDADVPIRRCFVNSDDHDEVTDDAMGMVTPSAHPVGLVELGKQG